MVVEGPIEVLTDRATRWRGGAGMDAVPGAGKLDEYEGHDSPTCLDYRQDRRRVAQVKPAVPSTGVAVAR